MAAPTLSPASNLDLDDEDPFADAPDPNGFPDDVMPPEEIYGSFKALEKAIQAWARDRGYAFRKLRSTLEKTGRLTVTFACDRSGKAPLTSIPRQRKTSTCKTDCQFSILAKESREAGVWSLSHRPGKQYAIHNHTPSCNPSAHSKHRHFDRDTKKRISELSAAGIPPQKIRNYLYKVSTTLATAQDIANEIKASQRRERGGKSSTEALLHELESRGFHSRVRRDQDNRLNALFFAHPESIHYLQDHPDLLLVDCTYKTNRYGMPLLDMIGVDACNKSFCIAFAFLPGEQEEDYL
jgi:hypothetical protein